MIGEGLTEEGFGTAYGIYKATYELGYWFQTPEAWDIRGDFRAIAYMRPLAIWCVSPSTFSLYTFSFRVGTNM